MKRMLALALILLIVTSCQAAPLPLPAPAPARVTAEISVLTVDPSPIPTSESSLNFDTTAILPFSAENGKMARQYLQAIAGDIGHREPGTQEEQLTAEYIQSVFEELGYSPQVQNFSFYNEDEEETLYSQNVIAVKEGRFEQVIVVGAHYDSAYEDGTQGADDNASGVAVMLEVAAKVQDIETPYTILFAAFGAEEYDLNGSHYFVDNLSKTERQNISGMFNLDSLVAGDKTYIYGNDGPGTMRDWVLEDAARLGFELEGKTAEDLNNEDGSPCECADYDAFEKAGIPYAYFEATNWDLSPDAMIQVNPQFGKRGEIRHTKFDTLDYLDATFPGRIDHHLHLFVTLLFNLLTQYQ
jgi:alkaline phosphatase isozyme conversion protein